MALPSREQEATRSTAERAQDDAALTTRQEALCAALPPPRAQSPAAGAGGAKLRVDAPSPAGPDDGALRRSPGGGGKRRRKRGRSFSGRNRHTLQRSDRTSFCDSEASEDVAPPARRRRTDEEEEDGYDTEVTSNTTYSRALKRARTEYFGTPHSEFVIDRLNRLFDWRWRSIMNASRLGSFTKVADEDDLFSDGVVLAVG